MSFIPQLKIQSDSQIKIIHEKGLEILERFGMQIEDPEIRTWLVDAGNRCEGDRIYFDADFIDKVMCASLSQLVLDNEMAGMVKRIMRPNLGLDFNEEELDEYLGFDAIETVVEEDETFLEQENTVEYLYKDEIYTPQVGFDSLFAEYLKRGEPSITAVAEEKAKELLAQDDVAPIDPALKAEVDQLIAAAEKEM